MHKGVPHGNRVSALDGLRGLAIALVLKHHFFSPGGGWPGVDLFFALSGYLITTILLAERDEERFWRIFYVRRVTRIVPAFVMLLLLCTAVMRVDWPKLWPYVLFSLTNVAMIRLPVEVSVAGLGILWSLCVEEHFYLVWPTLVRRLSVRSLGWTAVGIVVAEPLLRVLALLCGLEFPQQYFLTPFRLDAIALGSLLAIAPQYAAVQKPLARMTPFVLVGSVLMLLVPISPAGSTGRMVLFVLTYPTLVAVFGASFVAYVLQRREGVVARMLSIPPLTFLGRISYGLYLYHQPAYELLQRVAARSHFVHGRSLHAMGALFAILLAWLSFRFVETPALEYGRRKARMLRDESSLVTSAVASGQAR